MPSRDPRSLRSPLRSGLHPTNYQPSVQLICPLLTPRSASQTSPFQAGEASPGKNDDLPRTIAGSTPLPLGRKSFAVMGPLALVHNASYPVSVRRLASSLHASFSAHLTIRTLHFTSVPATRSQEDSHLLIIAHAGHSQKRRAGKHSLPGSSTQQKQLPNRTRKTQIKRSPVPSQWCGGAGGGIKQGQRPYAFTHLELPCRITTIPVAGPSFRTNFSPS